jgi:V8-like Glu-specific endopeptidase
MSLSAFEVTDRTSAPYASVCYIQVTWPDGTASRASGVVIGYNDVLTALHVVYQSEHGGWANDISVLPAADTKPWITPYGKFDNAGSVVGRAANWDLNGDGLLTQSESAGDLALIGMNTRIGDITGWLPVSQMPNDFSGVMAGYPASGSGMMAESVFADASSQYGVYDIASCLGPGASGGPLLMSSGGVTSVVGVLSSGNASDTASTYAGLFTSGTWSWLQGAMSANDSLLGSVPASTPSGLVYTGNATSETWSGGAGWDIFTGNGGNDQIDGAVGVDTAFFSGIRVGYAVSVSNGVVTVADSVNGRDGTDTLLSVERVRFADVSLAFDVNGSAGQAYRLYQASFNRAPDIGGLGFQMKALDDGLNLAQLAGNFLQSPEFSATYGNLSNEQFVTQLYANVLHRGPDAGGLAYHVGHLDSAVIARHDVLMQFSESPENQAALIGAMQNGMTYTV